jgi:hypothetical protein
MKHSFTLLLKCTLSVLLLALALTTQAQNLVLNPSFENTSSCPNGISQMNLATNWNSTNTGADSCSSPDLYAGCSWNIGGANSPNGLLGYQPSRTGTHHAGIILGEGFVGCVVLNDNYREYIEGQVSTPLVAGQKYLVKFYINLPENVMWGSNSLGVYFSNSLYTHNACSSGSLIPVTPQLQMCGPAIMDTFNWIPVQWVYTATGGEQYFTIGNYKNDAATNHVTRNCSSFNPYIYYYIDDVEISPIAPNQCGITILPDSVNATCGTNNGKVSITAQGCNTPFSYAWSSPGGTGTSLQNLGPGTYTVSVTDANSCTQTVAIQVNANPLSISDTAANPNCGSNNGLAGVTVRSGTGPYSYLWSNGATTPTITGLGAGSYSVVVTGATGCIARDTVTLLGASSISVATSSTPANCSGTGGTATATPSGGTAPYAYFWSNGQTTQTATGLAPGTYTVTVVGDTTATSGGAFWTENFTAGAGAWTLNTPGPGTNGGSANKWVVNNDNNCVCGSGNYLHLTCNSSALPCIGQSGQCTYLEFPSALGFGDYSTDVMAVSPIISTVGKSNITLTFDYESAGVSGADYGLVRLSSNGGTTWTTLPTVYVNTPNCTSASVSIPIAYQNNPNFRIAFEWINASGSSSNEPGFLVDNIILSAPANNCPATATVTVPSSSGINVAVRNHKDVNCFGGSTGNLAVSVTGGTGPYTYTWSPSVSSTDSASNLAAGSYTVSITDANLCGGSVTFTILQPLAALTATDSTAAAYCGSNTGKIFIRATGGTPNYTYQWSPPVSTKDTASGLAAGSYTVTVADAKGCSTTVTAVVSPASGGTLSLVSKTDALCNGDSTGKIKVIYTGAVAPIAYTWSPNVSSSDSAVRLPQGSYTINARDANGCTSTLSVNITEPSAITATTSSTQANCGVSDGSATVNATGGTGTLSYLWSGGNTTNVNSGVPAGNYTVTVTDANLCQLVTTVAVSNIGGPTATIAAQQNVSCHGGNTGKINLSVSGGANPYSYQWQPNVSTVDSATNLLAGVYNITVRDASSCIAVLSTTITEPAALSATTRAGNAGCGLSDGWAQILVNGGTGAYTYAWSVAQTTDSITALAGGKYYVTVTDGAGCQLTDSVTVGTNNAPVAPTITASGTITFCQGDSVILISSAATGNTGAMALLPSRSRLSLRDLTPSHKP